MNLNLNIAIASLFASASGGKFSIPGGRTVSPVQQRMRAKREADAPRRLAEAMEIREWNKNVKRRNRAFAVTGLNKHLRAA